MAGLFGRIFRQWFENAIVEKLSESRAMQRMAVSAVNSAKGAQKLAEEASKDPSKVSDGLMALFSALKQEASKDFSSVMGTAPSELAAPPAPPAAPPCEWKGKSVRELKEQCAKWKIDTSGMMEKSELVSALAQYSAAHRGQQEKDKLR